MDYSCQNAGKYSLGDMIIGRDILDYLGIDIQFSQLCIMCDTIQILMWSVDAMIADSFYVDDPKDHYTAVDWIKDILNTNYWPAHVILEYKKVNQLECVAPTFIIPKKNHTVYF